MARAAANAFAMTRKPTHAGRFKRWMVRAALRGPYSSPTDDDLERLATPRDGESELAARRRVLTEFADAASDSDRGDAATLTAAGFALAINGFLFQAGPLSDGVLVLLAAPAIGAFTFGLYSLSFVFVDRGPGGEESMENLQDAVGVVITKRFYGLVASGLALLALEFYAGALVWVALA
jgi:hypothetical protein